MNPRVVKAKLKINIIKRQLDKLAAFTACTVPASSQSHWKKKRKKPKPTVAVAILTLPYVFIVQSR